jgi:dienelactone hydrolase
MVSVVQPIVFKEGKLNYVVTFTMDEKLAGFNLRPYKEGETKRNNVENKETTEPEKSQDIVVNGTMEEIAKSYIGDLLNGEYEKAYNDYQYDDKMKSQITADMYKTIIESLYAQFGKVKEIGEEYTFELSGLTVVAVPVKLEKDGVNLEVYFDGDSRIAGLQTKPYQEKKLEKNIPDNIIEKELTAKVNGIELGGTLTLPKGDGEFPCVVLVHGSGTTDRDETILTNKPFRDIAWGLAEQGIAVYRYDKRTFVYPEQFKTGTELTIYDETINDAVEIAKMLQEVDGIDKDRIYILGHSLGGYAMPRIAKDSKEAAGFIIMAGTVRPAHVLIPEQYDYLFNLDGTVTDDEQKMLDYVKAEVDKIQNIDDYGDSEIFMGMYKAYVKDMISYDPIEVASTIERPVLVLQGERDYQVTMKDYNMWHDAYGDKDNWTFITYEKLNHLMIAGEGVPNNAEYSIEGSVDSKVINDIAEFVKK